MKKEDKITVICQIVRQIINENQLLEMDEAELGKILEYKEKTKKKEEDSKICLTSVIEKELENAIKTGQICESNAGMYQYVFDKSIKNSEIGNIPASELSDMLIRKFVLQAEKTYEMNRTRLKCFTGMVQTGLNKLAEEDMLDFVPVKHAKEYLGSKIVIQYINNPYTPEETERIKEWIELHPDDIRGMAIGLWFTGDVSLLEIANLKREECHKDIFKKWKRARFVAKALELHPKNKDYVFMAINDGKLEKLTPQSFQMKLYHVCNRLGINYKKINRDEAMVCKE